MSDDSKVREALAARSGTAASEWHLVFKARHGMRVVFETLGRLAGTGEVITQAFTCCTAVDPIVVAGHRPVYGSLAEASLSLDADRLTTGPETRAIVLQHTFGIIDAEESRRLRAVADRAGALLLEDSAHCVGRLADDAQQRPLADVSVHSFGIEKILPTRFGGAVWVSPAFAETAVGQAIVDALEELPEAGARYDLLVRAYRNELRVLTRLPRGISRPLQRSLTDRGLFEPAVAEIERRGGISRPAMRPPRRAVAQAVTALAALDDNERQRRQAVAVYTARLRGVVEIPQAVLDGAPQPLLRLPVMASDTAAAERVLHRLRTACVYATDWYRPALYPGVEDAAVYGYDGTAADQASSRRSIDRVVCLPTDVDAAEAQRVADLVAHELSVG